MFRKYAETIVSESEEIDDAPVKSLQKAMESDEKPFIAEVEVSKKQLTSKTEKTINELQSRYVYILEMRRRDVNSYLSNISKLLRCHVDDAMIKFPHFATQACTNVANVGFS